MSASPKEMLLGVSSGLQAFLNNTYFNLLLLTLTMAHMVVQAMRTNDADPTSFLTFLQDAFDYYMIWIYTFVACLRVWGSGLVLNEDSFLRQSWSYLDLIIVILAWADRTLYFGNFMFFMILRVAKLLVESSNVTNYLNPGPKTLNPKPQSPLRVTHYNGCTWVRVYLWLGLGFGFSWVQGRSAIVRMSQTLLCCQCRRGLCRRRA
jgi:hypothetical protein